MIRLRAFLILLACIALPAFSNGGPFIIRYPSGDSSARGGVAGIDSSLLPGEEKELKVVKEDLTFVVNPDSDPTQWGGFRGGYMSDSPLVNVSAAYTIENPTDKPITRKFGFPVIRGGVNTFGGSQAVATLGEDRLKMSILEERHIFNSIRWKARAAVHDALAADKELNKLVNSVRGAKTKTVTTATDSLAKFLTDKRKWRKEDAALLASYARISYLKYPFLSQDLDKKGERITKWTGDETGDHALLFTIGDLKATQLFAQLAHALNPQLATGYEAFFTDWGGDVREQTLDIETGKLRPRENSVKTKDDPTLYARVDYLNIYRESGDREDICKSILKNLPVIFTYAPMNLLCYEATFPAKSTKVLTVYYSQFAYADTKEPQTYQFNYVIHPAKHWQSFGPINLTVLAPKGVKLRASAALGEPVDDAFRDADLKDIPYVAHRAVLEEKPDLWFMAVDKGTWVREKPAPVPLPPLF